MAQGAVMLMLFAFMMCLSCLSSSAVGSGVFYACSDGTMSPGDFDIKKCTNFGFNDIIQGTETITGVDTSIDTSEDIVVDPGTDLLVVGRPLGLDDEDPNATFLDFFGNGKIQQPSGLGTVAHSVTSKAECAKICYENEVEMLGEGLECNGFVSDGFSKCILYPNPDTLDGSSLSGGEKSYGLKVTRTGEKFVPFSVLKFDTDLVADSYGRSSGANGEYGTPWAMGPATAVKCEKDGNNGLLTGFMARSIGDKSGFNYSCLMTGGISTKETTTTSTRQGQRNSCGGKSKGKKHDGSDIGYLDKHEVNCENSFISSWTVKPTGGWKNGSMTVKYACTKDMETPDQMSCEDYETEGNFGSRPCYLSALADTDHRVRCPINTALTQFKINDPAGKISYRCCPKPVIGGATTYNTRQD